MPKEKKRAKNANCEFVQNVQNESASEKFVESLVLSSAQTAAPPLAHHRMHKHSSSSLPQQHDSISLSLSLSLALSLSLKAHNFQKWVKWAICSEAYSKN